MHEILKDQVKILFKKVYLKHSFVHLNLLEKNMKEGTTFR